MSCDFMISNFQCQMEYGLFHTPIADNYDVGDRILQWGSFLDRKRNKLRKDFPAPKLVVTTNITTSSTSYRSTDQNTKSISGTLVDINAVPTYADVDTMTTATLQHLHMSELLTNGDDAVGSEGPNDIDVSRMVPDGQPNKDFKI